MVRFWMRFGGRANKIGGTKERKESKCLQGFTSEQAEDGTGINWLGGKYGGTDLGVKNRTSVWDMLS